jgi:pyruvate, orthophosphate dikinase
LPRWPRSACRCRPASPITTEVCTYYYKNKQGYPDGPSAQVAAALAAIETRGRTNFGDPTKPLLVSVRSGARVSMPGMMDTVLNLGLNDETVEGLAKASAMRASPGTYRRFIQMYGDVVLGVEHHRFEEMLEHAQARQGRSLDTELGAPTGTARRRLQGHGRGGHRGKPFPQDPHEQLWGAIGAVFGSWQNPRAVTYRRLHDIPADWGTAVNVQAMVFGNMGEDCATGVASRANPSTGENIFYGEYLINAQGEDVVAGIRTPQHPWPQGPRATRRAQRWKRPCPKAYAELAGGARPARTPLSRHAGHRVHGAARQALHAADAQRASAPQRRAQDRRRHGARRA